MVTLRSAVFQRGHYQAIVSIEEQYRAYNDHYLLHYARIIREERISYIYFWNSYVETENSKRFPFLGNIFGYMGRH